jgi:hypothetical protein
VPARGQPDLQDGQVSAVRRPVDCPCGLGDVTSTGRPHGVAPTRGFEVRNDRLPELRNDADQENEQTRILLGLPLMSRPGFYSPDNPQGNTKRTVQRPVADCALGTARRKQEVPLVLEANG